MKRTWQTYAFWIALAELTGALSGWLTRAGTERFQETVRQPPLSPPGIVFPIVWAVLFALMGAGAARVWLAPPSPQRMAAVPAADGGHALVRRAARVQFLLEHPLYSIFRFTAPRCSGWSRCGA